MGTREGPLRTVNLSCSGCKYEHSESYKCQGDSGHDVYCTHPAAPREEGAPMAFIADTNWRTPGWCPLRTKDGG